jgi:hypothetical protein
MPHGVDDKRPCGDLRRAWDGFGIALRGRRAVRHPRIPAACELAGSDGKETGEERTR